MSDFDRFVQGMMQRAQGQPVAPGTPTNVLAAFGIGNAPTAPPAAPVAVPVAPPQAGPPIPFTPYVTNVNGQQVGAPPNVQQEAAAAQAMLAQLRGMVLPQQPAPPPPPPPAPVVPTNVPVGQPQDVYGANPEPTMYQTVELDAGDGRGPQIFLVPTDRLPKDKPPGAVYLGQPVSADRVKDQAQPGQYLDAQPAAVQALFPTAATAQIQAQNQETAAYNQTTAQPNQTVPAYNSQKQVVPTPADQAKNQVPGTQAEVYGPEDLVRRGGDQTQPGSLPPITPADVAKTSPANAALMEKAGITEIPDGQMAVRQGERVTLRPADQPVPDGAQIIAYGGKTPKPQPPGMFDPVGSFLGVPVPRVVGDAMNLYDKPRQEAVGLIGDLIYEAAKSGNPISLGLLKGANLGPLGDIVGIDQLAGWASKNPNVVKDVYENGYTDPKTGQTYKGGRAVWERFQADQNIAQRATADITSDPLNALPGGGFLGAGEKAATILRGTEESVPLIRDLLAEGVTAGSRILGAPEKGTEIVGDLVGKAAPLVKEIPGVGKLLDQSTQTKLGRFVTEKGGALADFLQQAPRRIEEGQPVPVPPAPEGVLPNGDLRPREQPAVPTVPQEALPNGASTEPVPAQAALPNEPVPAQPEARPVEQLADNVRRTVAADGSRVIELRQPDGTWQEIMREGASTPPVVQTPNEPIIVGDVASPADPFKGTSLGEVPEGWGFLSPSTTDNRIITQAAALGQQYPDRWAKFVAEHDAAAQSFVRRQIPGRYAENALDEARYVIDSLIPDFQRNFGDIAPLPEYQWRYRPGPQAPAAKRNFQTADRETLVERAIFDTNPKAAQGALNVIKDRAYQLDEAKNVKLTPQGRPLVKDPQLAAVYDQIAPLRQKYMEARQARPVFENTPLGHVAPQPEAATEQLGGIDNLMTAPHAGQFYERTVSDLRAVRAATAEERAGIASDLNNQFTGMTSANDLDLTKLSRGDLAYEAQRRAILIDEAKRVAAMPPDRRARYEPLVRQDAADLGGYTERRINEVLAPSQEAAPVGETPAPTQAAQAPVEPAAPQQAVEQAPTAPEVTPAAPVSQGAVATDSVVMPLREVQVDPVRFQPRDTTGNALGVDEAKVADIAANWNQSKYNAEPIVVWRDPADGQTYLLSGHHRYAAMEQRGTSAAKVNIFSGSEAEAVDYARTANQLRNQKEMEIAREIQRQVAQGNSVTDAGKAMGVRSRSLANAYLDLNRLPADMQAEIDAGRLSVKNGGLFARAIDDGSVTAADVQRYYRQQIEQGRGLTETRVRDWTEGKRLRKANQGTSAGTLFDVNAYGEGEDQAIEQAMALMREHNRLVTSTKRLLKTDRVVNNEAYRNELMGQMLESEQTALQAKADAGLALPKDRERLAELTQAQSELSQPPTPLRTVQTPSGPQGAMDLGAANRPVMQTGGATPGAAMGAEDLLQPPELTPEQIRAQQRAAGQTDLFGGPDVNAAADGPIYARLYPDFREMGRQYTAGAKELGRMLSTPVPNPVAAAERLRPRLTASVGPVETLRGRVLGDVEANQMAYRFSDTGQTLLERWDERATELERGGNGPQQLGTFSNPGMDRESAEVQAAGEVLNEAAADYLSQIDPKAYDRYTRRFEELTTRTKDPVDVAIARASALMQATARARIPIYDDALGVLREGILYNTLTGWRYIATQNVGNTITALLTRKFGIIGEALNPKRQLDIFHALRNDLPGNADRVLWTDTEALYADLGLTVKQDVRAIHRDEIGVSLDARADRRTKTQRFAEKMRLGSFNIAETKLGKAASGLYANRFVRDLANSNDLSMREALAGYEVLGRLPVARRDLIESAIAARPRDVPEQAVRDVFEKLPYGRFSSDDLRQAFADAGFKPSYGDRVARDWRNATSRIDQAAREEVRRVFFSGDMTNLDQALGRVVLFHYWMSRAIPLYASSMLKNPGMLAAYARMMEAAQNSTEGYPDPVKNFYKFMNTPYGYTMFLKPDAFFQMTLPFWQDSGYAPDGENWLGKHLRTSGLYLNPILDTVFNLAGAEGDTFAPDPLALGQWTRLVKSGMDFAKSRGWISGDAPTNDAYAQMMTWLRSNTSGIVPGTTNIPNRDQAVYARREINQLILAIAQEKGIPTDDPTVYAAMDDPSSALFQEAFRRYSDAKLADQALRFAPVTSIFYPKQRVTSADQRTMDIAAAPKGSPQITALYAERDLTNTTDPRARALKVADNQWKAVGDPAARTAYSTYYAIKNGDISQPITVGGAVYQPDVVKAGTQEQRDALARQWVVEQNAAEAIVGQQQARDAFEAQNPEYKAYRDWQSQVRQYPGGAEAWWRDTSVANPNAARYYRSLKVTHTDFDLTSPQAFLAYSGVPASYRDYNPAPVRDPSKVPYNPAVEGPLAQPQTGSGGNQYGGGVTADTIARDITVYQRKVADYNALAGSMLEQDGFDIDKVNPMARSAIVANMESRYGVSLPQMGSAGAGYVKWVQAQTPGAPTDVASYLEWRRQMQVSQFGIDPNNPLAQPPTPIAAP